jgi:hypothetical protein
MLSGSGFAQIHEIGKTSLVVLEVKDASGAIVEGAQVQILPLPDTIGKNLRTDREGKLSLALPSGTYDLTAKRPGLLPSTQRIEAEADKHQTIVFVLKPMSCPPGYCIEVTDGTMLTNVFPVSFPDQSQAVSPDGRYAVLNIDSDRKPHHRAVLEDRSLKTRRKLFDYERHIVLLWDYDSQMFAVTDYIGTDSSTCSIISVDDKVPRLEAVDLLLRQLSEDAKKTLQSELSNHHAYVEASVWVRPTTLVLKVSGYGDKNSKGFSEFYNLLVPLRDLEIPANRLLPSIPARLNVVAPESR